MANLNYYKSKLKHLTLTEWLIGINIFMFLLTQVIDFTSGGALIKLGAKVNFLIGMGEFWRLLTSMFLHADLMHLIFNMLALYILGKDIERFFGKTKFVILYFVSGLIGSAFSYLLVSNVSVGASGAIFGLMGANLFLYKINPTVYKRIYGTDFLVLIGLNLILGLIRPNIDMAGHVGGLIGGFTTAFALGLRHESMKSKKRIPLQIAVVLILLVPVTIATGIQRRKPETFASAAYYHYSVGHIKTAHRYIDQGIDKFPELDDLKLIKDALNP